MDKRMLILSKHSRQFIMEHAKKNSCYLCVASFTKSRFFCSFPGSYDGKIVGKVTMPVHFSLQIVTQYMFKQLSHKRRNLL